jgi:hypothetical protein
MMGAAGRKREEGSSKTKWELLTGICGLQWWISSFR